MVRDVDSVGSQIQYGAPGLVLSARRANMHTAAIGQDAVGALERGRLGGGLDSTKFIRDCSVLIEGGGISFKCGCFAILAHEAEPLMLTPTDHHTVIPAHNTHMANLLERMHIATAPGIIRELNVTEQVMLPCGGGRGECKKTILDRV